MFLKMYILLDKTETLAFQYKEEEKDVEDIEGDFEHIMCPSPP